MAKVFVDWEEIFVSNDKGSRVVHYYLKDSHGNSDLAVVGREKSLRHMVYTVPSQFLRLADVHGFQPSSSLKWRSKREVVDWLSSLIADYASYQASPAVHLSSDDEDPLEDPLVWKGLSSKKSRFHSKEFTWLGSSWKCRKRRKHYRAFNRNGIKITVHDFVFVMSEENRRLVAYLEDMYEDSRGNKMVVVRWFNNADEVGIVSPPRFSDREIFFSLCLQDLSVECVDGLATVLSSQHFEKYLNEARETRCEPFVCRRLVDGADFKPFDMTQLQGYWNQKILRHMYSSPARSFLKPLSPSYFNQGEEATNNTNKSKSKVKDGLSLEWKSQAPNLSRKGNGSVTAVEIEDLGRTPIANRTEVGVGNGGSAATRKITNKQKPQQQFSTGCQIEVLSQDSGIRGCWFRAVILKRHGEKVKVQYQDLLDADETGKLEEWVLLSRAATVNDLGTRVCGRTTVRPCPPTKCRLTKGFDVGTIVDARWHDGWWEGIVVFRETEDKVLVYFPGERKTEVFETNSLRHSQEWFSNKWSFLKERPDVARSVNSKDEARVLDKPEPSDLHERGSGEARPLGTPQQETSAPSDDTKILKPRVGVLSETEIRLSPSSEPPAAVDRKREREEAWPVNLEKDNLLAGLKWNPSKKRRRGSLSHKTGSRRHSDGSSSSSREEDDVDASSPGTSFLIPSDMKVDVENCKYGGTTPLVIANMPPLSSLVMSR
ncbi:hypothetical protein EJ110_NYTH08438 [Nymphaea thermarum]|nr:hypothetical protein EJ110_NYTH08438 [Nymphaea thermarum]